MDLPQQQVVNSPTVCVDTGPQYPNINIPLGAISTMITSMKSKHGSIPFKYNVVR